MRHFQSQVNQWEATEFTSVGKASIAWITVLMKSSGSGVRSTWKQRKSNVDKLLGIFAYVNKTYKYHLV